MMPEYLNFDGQEVTYHKEKNVLELIINSTFKTAGRYFNSKEGMEGISINKEIIDLAARNKITIIIHLTEQKKTYITLAEYWKNYCERTNSYYIKSTPIRKIVLCVYPLHLLDEVKDKKTKTYYDKQLTLNTNQMKGGYS